MNSGSGWERVTSDSNGAGADRTDDFATCWCRLTLNHNRLRCTSQKSNRYSLSACRRVLASILGVHAVA